MLNINLLLKNREKTNRERTMIMFSISPQSSESSVLTVVLRVPVGDQSLVDRPVSLGGWVDRLLGGGGGGGVVDDGGGGQGHQTGVDRGGNVWDGLVGVVEVDVCRGGAGDNPGRVGPS